MADVFVADYRFSELFMLCTLIVAVVCNAGVVQFSISCSRVVCSAQTIEDFKNTRCIHGTINHSVTVKTMKSLNDITSGCPVDKHIR